MFHVGIIAATLAIQFLLISITFPIQELFTVKPLLRVDSAFHWYQIWAATKFGAFSPLAGFDPHMSAGYLNGVTYNASARAPALFAALFPAIAHPAIIYKCFSFFSALLAPACLALAARVLRLSHIHTAFMALIGIVIWWTSDLRGYHTSGMISFVFASFWGITYAAAIIQLVTDKFSIWKSLLLGIVGAAGFFYHPLFPVIVLLIVWAPLIFLRQAIIWRTLWISCIVIGACALLPNLPWILLTLKYPSVIDNSLMPYFKKTGIFLISRQLFGLDYAGSKFHVALVLAAGWGCIYAESELKRQLARTFTASSALFLIFGAFGAGLSAIAPLQPNRFLMTGFLVLSLPAAIGAAHIWKNIRGSLTPSKALLAAALLTVITGYSLNELRREISWEPIGHHGAVPPEVRGEGEKTRWLVNWINSNTDSNSRILFEHSSHGVYDIAHIPGYLATQTNREFIGGAYPMKTSTSFWDGWIFGQMIDAYSTNELLNYFRVYNIGWAITHSTKSIEYFNKFPSAKLAAEFGEIKIFRIENPPGFVFNGQGKVIERDINRIVVSGISTEDIVLRYHFLPCLTTSPPAQIDGVIVEQNLAPFIRLRTPNPTATITCRP
ncbi:MAG TPA: hypothetical protein VM532_15635 [Burkholderiales bacterium]|nr:hypothetical protein [Burkholderiales bacterium]